MIKYLLITIILNGNIQAKPVAVFDTRAECEQAQVIVPKLVKTPKDKQVYIGCVELK